MDWTRSETLALAKHSCATCLGTGSHPGENGRPRPCNCVLRSIFRACYGRFRHCVEKEKYISRVSLERIPGGQHRLAWGRKDEEYVADFVLVSRRTLTEADYRVFSSHFLLGADWKLCCRQMNLDRGTFFHTVYRIEQKLGRTFRELEPYGLFPLDQYFGGSVRVMACSQRKLPRRLEDSFDNRFARAS